MIEKENLNFDDLPRPIIGVDEVGRGCLAGPVCAGAVCLSDDSFWYKDSKTLSPIKRQVFYKEITEKHQTALGFASVEEIDQINILQASLLAMKRAVLSLNLSKGTVIVDGSFLIPNLKTFKQMAVIKGDTKVSCIGAASIIAKHYRDEWLKKLSKEYPGYGFEKHKGYSSMLHRQAIEKLGPCSIHRKTFSGVKEFLSLSI